MLRRGRSPKEVSDWESDDCRRVSELLAHVFDQNGLGVEIKDKKPLSPVVQEMRRKELYNGIMKKHAYNDVMGGRAYCCLLAEIVDSAPEPPQQELDNTPPPGKTSKLVGSVEVTLMRAGATGTPIRMSDLQTIGIPSSQWYAYVGSMAILPDYRQLGIGSLLLKQAERLVAVENKLSPGVNFILLEVACDNEKARALYLKHSYDEIRIDPLWQQQWLGIPRLVLMAKRKCLVEDPASV